MSSVGMKRKTDTKESLTTNKKFKYLFYNWILFNTYDFIISREDSIYDLMYNWACIISHFHFFFVFGAL